jgi:hypothetical protein
VPIYQFLSDYYGGEVRQGKTSVYPQIMIEQISRLRALDRSITAFAFPPSVHIDIPALPEAAVMRSDLMCDPMRYRISDEVWQQD